MIAAPSYQPRALLLLALALLATAAFAESCERRVIARARARAACCAPCILLTLDPRSAGPVEAAVVDTCPGDCAPAGAYCVRVTSREARP